MFGRRSEKQIIDEFTKQVACLIEKEMPVFVDCDKCKCMIRKDLAFQGESTVEKEMDINIHYLGKISSQRGEESILEHYFCHRCKPKKK